MVQCRALLFDLDGVLVDSLPVVARVLRAWAASRGGGLDADLLIKTSQGRRTSEMLRAVAPWLDIPHEVEILDDLEERETESMHAMAGAKQLLDRLTPGQWAIVTSGSRRLSTSRLKNAGLPIPPVFVTGDQVERGKPDPECYLLAASLLGVAPADALVLEDAPIGIAAAKAAGIRAIGVAPNGVTLADAVLTVPAPSGLRLEQLPGGWIEILSAP
jgi:mannitol-1-/sugar-/sorbitol-6-phosphatase